MSLLQANFFLRDDVVQIAKELIGKELIHVLPDGTELSGIICETEAYRAPEDKASHAFGMKRTQRTETMFMQGGCAYIYLCYGIHELFNIVTNSEGIPHAVLIRGIVPKKGLEQQLTNRKASSYKRGLMIGPGKVTKALSITRELDGASILENSIQIHEGIAIAENLLQSGPRIGIEYAQEWKEMPWRFWV
ncbi:DNA-3-methyladenine glycosylase, partial [bacterium]